MLCSCCDKPLQEFPTDWAQEWPKAYFDLLPTERRRLVGRSDKGDLVDIDRRRWFVRGVLYVPITGTDFRMGHGLYAEMRKTSLDELVRDYWHKTAKDSDIEWDAKLSSTRVPMYPELDGLPIKIRLDPRPGMRVNFIATPPGHCYEDQRAGSSVERWHEYVRLMGD